MNRLMPPIAGALTLLTLAVSGCQGGYLPSSSLTIDTVVAPLEARAGDQVSVRCEVFTQSGLPFEWATRVDVEPLDGITIDGGTATPTAVGTYTFTCRSEDGNWKDDSPAVLTVISADPASTVATVDPETIAAGATATTTCTVYDAFGNVIPEAVASVDQTPGLDVNGMLVGSTKPGGYSVECSVQGFEVTKTAARLTVTAADPVRLEITANPDKANYAIGDTTLVGWKVYDAYDNLIEGLPATVTPATNPGMDALGGNKFRFNGEGHFNVGVALDAPWESIKNSRIFVCDTSAPTIEDLFPPRGYTQTGDPTLVVRGTLKDAAGSKTTYVSVNGVQATVNADGTFELPTTGKHGLNALVIVARDEFDHEMFVTRGWYYSSKFLKVDDTTTMDDVILPESVLANLGQKFLDDGVHDPADPNDLATLVEMLLGSLIQPLLANIPPIPFQIPNAINVSLAGFGLQGDLEVVITVKDIVLGKPSVRLNLLDGGISAGIGFQPVSVGLELSFIIHARAIGFGQTIPLLDPSTTSSGSLSVGTLDLTLALDISKPLGGESSVAGRDFGLTLTDISLSPIESLKIKLGKVPNTIIDLGEVDLTWLVAGLNDLLSQYVLNPLADMITQPLIDLLAPLVISLIGDPIKQVLDMLNIRQSIPLPDLLGTGNSVDLQLGLDLSSVAFTTEAGRIGLDLGFLTTKAVPREPPLGTILRDACDQTEENPPQFVFPATPSVQLGLSHDAINELLFMVWWGGVLQGQFDASSLIGGGGGSAIPVENVLITPTLWLPPIFNDCGEATQRIEIGDMFVEIQMDLLGNTQWLEAWLQVSVEVSIITDGNQVGIKIGKIQELQYELYDVGGGLTDLLDMLTPMIPDLLNGISGQQFMFPIPAIPLDGLLPGIPAGTSLQLGNLDSAVETGVIRVGGDLL